MASTSPPSSLLSRYLLKCVKDPIPVLGVCVVSVLLACGSDRTGRRGDGGPDLDGGAGPHGDGGPDADDGGWSDVVSPSGCEPSSCDELGAECGAAPDGCGGVAECGDCGDGEACSVEAANKCTKLAELCRPVAEAEACAGKGCGLEGDGCGGTHDCGSCGPGEACGFGGPFQCGEDAVPGDDQNCPAKIESCASVGLQCGVIGNGCGGTLDCTAELGPCASGTVCGALTPYRCDAPLPPSCTPAASCAALGWQCGVAIDDCGNQHSCATEGRTCSPLEACVGGITGPTECVTSTTPGENCPLCTAVPGCSGQAQPTRLTGRVLTPGRTDGDAANQVGVPNAFVYILRTNSVADLPAISSGLPSGGSSCDRCSDQDLGPVLASATTDATGRYTLQGNIPVGTEFLLVVKVGKFRRAARHTLSAGAACQTTALPAALPGNPTRLPRSMSDGLAVNIPRIAVSTGRIDAMECVFEKLGIAHAEFGNPGASGTAAPRIHLYRGGLNSGSPPGSGARISDGTPHDSVLYGSLGRMSIYDMVVADCEGQDWDGSFTERDANGGNVRQYVNRGGRLFASHLSFSWLHQNGAQAYTAGDPIATGLANAASWDTGLYLDTSGTGVISVGRPSASPRIQRFADWAANEALASPPGYQFTITDPRSMATGLGAQSEEWVFRQGGNGRVQQFSFNTPYAAPSAAACGRIAYSGFHVAATGGGTSPFATSVFPAHCTGSLTAQEKILLYMLFDLGLCVGNEPTPPACSPSQCAGRCGVVPNGCGGVLECGPCPPQCRPTTCAEQGATCGAIGDSCGAILQCGTCPPGQVCGASAPNECGVGRCTPRSCDEANAACGTIGDGCGDLVDCGPCPDGQVCGIETPFQCGEPPVCTPLTCGGDGAHCGQLADGCGGVIDCEPCQGPLN